MRAPPAERRRPIFGAPIKPQATPEPESDGLKGLARKLTMRKPSDTRAAEPKSWEMKTLLAAAEQDSGIRVWKSDRLVWIPPPLRGAGIGAGRHGHRPVAAGHRRTGRRRLETLSGGRPRAVFARRLADTIDDTAVDRITSLSR